MNQLEIIKSFVRDETGAVTVDWVVLTAGIVGLGIIVTTKIGTGVVTVGTNITTAVDASTVGYTTP
jgi:Flp pilus assembly pilin Flp